MGGACLGSSPLARAKTGEGQKKAWSHILEGEGTFPGYLSCLTPVLDLPLFTLSTLSKQVTSFFSKLIV